MHLGNVASKSIIPLVAACIYVHWPVVFIAVHLNSKLFNDEFLGCFINLKIIHSFHRISFHNYGSVWKTSICLHFLKHSVKITSQFHPFAKQIIIIGIKTYKINLEKYLTVGKCSNLPNIQRGRVIVYLKRAITSKNCLHLLLPNVIARARN